MLINIILILIFIGSLGSILFIIIRKFPLLANIDVSQIQFQEKQKEVKRMLIEQQLKKDFKFILNFFEQLFIKIYFFVRKIFKKSSSL